jgi:hypothetical protein
LLISNQFLKIDFIMLRYLSLAGVRSINLVGCNVTDAGIAHIVGVGEIDIRGTSVTALGIQTLMNSNPNYIIKKN